jgi:NAD-dependent SIR2 family protein deacetylase
MELRECAECGGEYDPESPEKKQAGGKIIHCPDCSEETVVRYLGVKNASGKQAGIEILAFDCPSEREEYRQFWQVNSGLFTGKSCQISRLAATPNVTFKKVAENRGCDNHKGKA